MQSAAAAAVDAKRIAADDEVDVGCLLADAAVATDAKRADDDAHAGRAAVACYRAAAAFQYAPPWRAGEIDLAGQFERC